MGKELKDTLEVATEAFRAVYVRAEGDPAKTVAVGVAAAVVFVGVGVGYGMYRFGERVIKGKLTHRQ